MLIKDLQKLLETVDPEAVVLVETWDDRLLAKKVEIKEVIQTDNGYFIDKDTESTFDWLKELSFKEPSIKAFVIKGE